MVVANDWGLDRSGRMLRLAFGRIKTVQGDLFNEELRNSQSSHISDCSDSVFMPTG